MAEEKRTELSDLGEFGLIRELTKELTPRVESTVKSVGDDAAVIDKNEEEYQLISTDFLMEGIHFDLSYTPLKHLGYKSIAVNVSDIAAMNGIPEQVTVSLAVSNRISYEAIRELYEGIEMACKDYHIDLVGGDTTSSLSGFLISVSIIGKVQKKNVVYRSGAKVNDMICVTGDLGAAYVGLQLLEREKQVFLANEQMKPQLEGNEYLIERILKPQARMDVIHAFGGENFVPSAMIDVSDGLASELLHLSSQSDKGVEVWDENIPIDNRTYEQALEFNIDPATCALNGGEDYELLFTCSEDDYKKIEKLPDIHPIGKVTEKSTGRKFVTKQGNVYDLKAQGWNHFSE